MLKVSGVKTFCVTNQWQFEILYLNSAYDELLAHTVECKCDAVTAKAEVHPVVGYFVKVEVLYWKVCFNFICRSSQKNIGVHFHLQVFVEGCRNVFQFHFFGVTSKIIGKLKAAEGNNFSFAGAVSGFPVGGVSAPVKFGYIKGVFYAKYFYTLGGQRFFKQNGITVINDAQFWNNLHHRLF